MATTPKNRDRRAQRTQQLLKQAFVEILKEKDFPTISIQDVADRANVNRGTFYAHFTDKYALLEAVICEEMQRTMDTLPPVSQWDRSTLQLFIRMVLDYCDDEYRYLHLAENVMPQFERIAHEGMVEFLLVWLKQNVGIRSPVSLETIAQIMSWAILGAVVQRCRASTTIPSDEMASAVLLVMMKGVDQLAMVGQEAI